MIVIVGVSRAAVMATGAVATGSSSANDSLHLQTPLRGGRLLLATRPALESTAPNSGSVLPARWMSPSPANAAAQVGAAWQGSSVAVGHHWRPCQHRRHPGQQWRGLRVYFLPPSHIQPLQHGGPRGSRPPAEARGTVALASDPNAAQNELQAALPQVLPAPPSGPPIAVTFPAAMPAGAAARHPVGMTRQAQKTYTRVQRHESRSPTRGGSG